MKTRVPVVCEMMMVASVGSVGVVVLWVPMRRQRDYTPSPSPLLATVCLGARACPRMMRSNSKLQTKNLHLHHHHHYHHHRRRRRPRHHHRETPASSSSYYYYYDYSAAVVDVPFHPYSALLVDGAALWSFVVVVVVAVAVAVVS